MCKQEHIECLSGNMLGCSSEKNGEWKKNFVKKSHMLWKKRIIDDATSDESGDEDFICDFSEPESDISVDENNNYTSLEDINLEKYVLYVSEQKNVHLASIVEYTVDKVILKIARKYGIRGNQITFIWPAVDQLVVVENFAKHLKGLPDPIADRRYSLTFRLEAFGKILPKNIL